MGAYEEAQFQTDSYEKYYRPAEIAAFFAFAILIAALFWRIAPNLIFAPWLLICSFILALLAADFFSGMVHWGADTWGKVDFPIIGQSILRSFREHHVFPQKIVNHDFIERNGHNVLLALPVVVLAHFLPSGAEYLFLKAFLAFMLVGIAFTNEIHAWAHSKKAPRIVKLMQKCRLILPPTNHQQHHTAPFSRNYCITTGWLNPTLSTIGFFPALEWSISKVTGAIPRGDKLSEYALAAYAKKVTVIKQSVSSFRDK